MEKIRMVDLHSQYLRIKAEVDSAIQNVLESTAFIQGPQVAGFAKALAAYTDCPHVIPCANGTDALQIAMMALDLKPGDEVIVPVHTYVATAEVIALLNLVPVFVDVEEDTFNIDVKMVSSKISAKTKAIVPVHLYGQCANMDALMAIARERKLFVIEDTAQALGAEYISSNGVKTFAGTIGDIGTTSFFPSKNLGCFGDGGALFVRNAEMAEHIRMIANHGQQKKYHHDIIGINSRLDTLQAAILSVKLKYLDEYRSRRQEVAAFYDKGLGAISGLTIPARSAFSTHVFHQYTVRVHNGKRDALKQLLESKEIPTMIYYPVPLHMQKAYRREGFGEGSFPVTERLSREVLSLPIHTEMTEDQLHFITDTIKSFFS